MVEIRAASETDALAIGRTLECDLDPDFAPVAMAGGTFVLRCHVADADKVDQIKRHPEIVEIWKDTPIAPM